MNRTVWRRRQLLLYGGLSAAGVATALTLRSPSTMPGLTNKLLAKNTPSSSTVGVIPLPSARSPLPEFRGISQWLNSDPLAIGNLKGNIVLIQFWTFSCINCQRTLPSLVQWHQQYASQGLKVVGIHTPEFAYERDINNIKRALRQHEITYPVAVDNDYQMWRAYHNEYWPHLFLADRQGQLRYDHIGEGAYEETERLINQLLG